MLAVWSSIAFGCTGALSSTAMDTRLDELSMFLEASKSDELSSATQSLLEELPCLRGQPSPEQIQRVRIFEGIDLFLRDSPDLAARSFLAARSISSEAVLPVFPEGHEIFRHFTAYDPVQARRQRLVPPKRGELQLNGLSTRERVMDAPAVATLTENGALVSVQLLEPDELPTYKIRQPQRVPLIAATSALGVTSVVLLSQVPRTNSAFQDLSKSESELTRLKFQNNAYWIGGVTAGLFAVGSGTATALWWSR